MQNGQMKNIPTDLIFRHPDAGLRDAQIETEEFQSLLADIRTNGILEPIMVTPRLVDGVDKYEIINGLQRYTAATMLGLADIKCVVYTGLDTADLLVMQISANHQRVPTKPAQYAQALYTISKEKGYNKPELAAKVCLSEATIDRYMGLLKLAPEVKEAVDAGAITIQNASALGRLKSPEEQVAMLEFAGEKADDFAVRVDARKKEIDAANKVGKVAKPNVFTPMARLRTRADIEAEITAAEQAGKNSDYIDALKWCIQLDPDSVAKDRAKYEQGLLEAEKKKAAKDAEKQAKVDAQKKLAEAALA